MNQHPHRSPTAIRRLAPILAMMSLLACGSPGPANQPVPPFPEEMATESDRNERLLALARTAPATAETGEYRVGSGDLLDVLVFDAPDLSGEFRVSGDGVLSLPLLGPMRVDGRTTGEVETLLRDSLSATYMKEPRVSIQVAEMGSHGVSVMGAVQQPGVLQIRTSVTLLEVLAMAEGLAEDAGETILVARRGAGPEVLSRAASSTDLGLSEDSIAGWDTSLAQSGDTADAHLFTEIEISRLLDGAHPRENVAVHPGDIVLVEHTGVVYVVGEVNEPGGFPIGSRERLTIAQALALAGGVTRTAAPGRGRIIRTDDDGMRREISVDLDDALEGESSNLVLRPRDVIFVPNSTAKSMMRGALDALVRMVTLRGLFGG